MPIIYKLINNNKIEPYYTFEHDIDEVFTNDN